MAQLLLLPMTTFFSSSSEGKNQCTAIRLPWNAVAFLKPEGHLLQSLRQGMILTTLI